MIKHVIHTHNLDKVMVNFEIYLTAKLTYYQTLSGLNGAPTVQTHPSNHRQQHRTWPHNGHYDFKILQVQRHEVPVVEMTQSAAAICIPMDTWAKNCADNPIQHHHGPHHLHIQTNYIVKQYSHHIELNSYEYICTYIR